MRAQVFFFFVFFPLSFLIVKRIKTYIKSTKTIKIKNVKQQKSTILKDLVWKSPLSAPRDMDRKCI